MDIQKLNCATRNEIDSILINKLNTVKNLVLLIKLKSNDHMMVKYKVTLGLMR